MRVTRAASSLAALLVLTSCANSSAATGAAGQPSSENAASAPSATATPSGSGGTVPAHSPGVVRGPAGTVAVQVSEPSTRAEQAVRYLRVEDGSGKTVTEQSYQGTPVVLSDALPVGSYRLITWLRACSGSCAGANDDALAPPSQVCGSRFQVTRDEVTRLVVKASAGTACSVEAG